MFFLVRLCCCACFSAGLSGVEELLFHGHLENLLGFFLFIFIQFLFLACFVFSRIKKIRSYRPSFPPHPEPRSEWYGQAKKKKKKNRKRKRNNERKKEEDGPFLQCFSYVRTRRRRRRKRLETRKNPPVDSLTAGKELSQSHPDKKSSCLSFFLFCWMVFRWMDDSRRRRRRRFLIAINIRCARDRLITQLGLSGRFVSSYSAETGLMWPTCSRRTRPKSISSLLVYPLTIRWTRSWLPLNHHLYSRKRKRENILSMSPAPATHTCAIHFIPSTVPGSFFIFPAAENIRDLFRRLSFARKQRDKTRERKEKGIHI